MFLASRQSGLYVAIGNLSSKICQMPSTHSVVMVTLLPVLIKMRNISQKRLDEQRKTNREVLNEVLRRLLQPPTFNTIPEPGQGITKFSVQMATSGIANRL